MDGSSAFFFVDDIWFIRKMWPPRFSRWSGKGGRGRGVQGGRACSYLHVAVVWPLTTRPRWDGALFLPEGFSMANCYRKGKVCVCVCVCVCVEYWSVIECVFNLVDDNLCKGVMEVWVYLMKKKSCLFSRVGAVNRWSEFSVGGLVYFYLSLVNYVSHPRCTVLYCIAPHCKFVEYYV